MRSFDRHLFVFGGKSNCDDAPMPNVYKCFDDDKFDWINLAPMEIPRCDFSSVIYGNFIYVFGGTTDSGITSKCSKYDISADSWIPVSDMPKALTGTAPEIYKNEIYLVGGAKEGEYGTEEVKDVYVYSPETDSWRSGPSMDTEKTSCSLVNVNGVLHAFGGMSGDDFLGSLYEVLEDGEWVKYSDGELDGFIGGVVRL